MTKKKSAAKKFLWQKDDLEEVDDKKKKGVAMKGTIRHKGGSGSGHHGHRGRPGKQGGSVPGTGGGGAGIQGQVDTGYDIKLSDEVYPAKIDAGMVKNVEFPTKYNDDPVVHLYNGDRLELTGRDAEEFNAWWNQQGEPAARDFRSGVGQPENPIEVSMIEALESSLITSKLRTTELVHLDFRQRKGSVLLEDVGGYFGHQRTIISLDQAKRGGFTLDDLVKFLKKHGTEKIKPRRRFSPNIPVYD